jgi:hypothetical protein
MARKVCCSAASYNANFLNCHAEDAIQGVDEANKNKLLHSTSALAL